MLCDDPDCMCVLWLYKLFIWSKILKYYSAAFFTHHIQIDGAIPSYDAPEDSAPDFERSPTLCQEVELCLLDNRRQVSWTCNFLEGNLNGSS